MVDDIDVPPPDNGWAPGTEPVVGQTVEVQEVELREREESVLGVLPIAPIVVGVAGGYVGTMLFTGDKGWVLDKVIDPLTRQPVTDFRPPPVLYSEAHSMTFRWNGDRYIPSGNAQIRIQ